MDIDWRVPFEFAFELSLFIIGLVLVVFVSLIGLTLIVGTFKALIAVVRGETTKKEVKVDVAGLPVNVAHILNKRRDLDE